VTAGDGPPPPAAAAAESLATPAGDVALADYRLGLGGRTWSVLHTAAVLSHDDEQQFLREQRDRLPYGVVLWPAAVALAHEVAARAGEFRGRRVLELGAGTGLPGVVAASFGAGVVQTDRHELALGVCRRNGARNAAAGGAVAPITYRLADWTAWDDAERYDWILGSDVLYGETTHPHLRGIFAGNLAPGGRVLLADPFRAVSLRLLEALEGDGWAVRMSKWTVGDAAGEAPRPVGVFELTPPG
jgi:predicted nicotinamide N-methyase